jgi:uncharacterized Rmd1/YagE family protein
MCRISSIGMLRLAPWTLATERNYAKYTTTVKRVEILVAWMNYISHLILTLDQNIIETHIQKRRATVVLIIGVELCLIHGSTAEAP